MLRVLLAIGFMIATGGVVCAQTPTYVQGVTSGQDGATAQNATPNVTLQITLPQGAQSGNTLIFCFTYWSGGTLAGSPVTDDHSNTWSLAKSVTDATNSTITAVYYSQGVAAGTRVVTANWSNHPGASANSNIMGHLSEWFNITGGLDGTNSATGLTSSPYSTSSVTTTVNGDLVLGFVTPVWNSGSNTITSVTSNGGGFTLLSGSSHMGGSTSNAFGAVYQVQGTAGAINPGIAMGGTPNQAVEGITVAFKAGAAGAANTSAFRITDVQMMFIGATTVGAMPFPCSSAATAIVMGINTADTLDNPNLSVSGASGTWQVATNSTGKNTTSHDAAMIWYTLNATCSSTATITVTQSANATGDPIALVYAVVGLSAFDVGANTNGNDTTSTAGSPLSAGSITPTNANEVIFASLAISWNDIQSVAVSSESPIFQCMVNANLADGISGNSPLCEDNGHAFLNNSSGGAKAFNWNGTHTDTHASGGFGQWAVGLAAFTLSSGATPCFRMLLGVGCEE